MSEKLVKVAEISELSPGKAKMVEVEGMRIVLIQLDNGYYAIDDTCTHEEVSLSDGYIEGEEIECPEHGSRFNIKTGAVLNLPAVFPVRTYKVTVEGNDISILFPSES